MTPLVARQRQHYSGRGRPKVAHPTEAAATAHLERMVGLHPGIEANVYRCCVCSWWHVGQPSAAPRRRRT